ncbi:hypothetical protein AB0O34_22470 [Sphaerisporangium sp. NPDC088356]|uniref:hypothetical protein n=1 Tax=Sphaerisporangium sp. NPDC088356 TaxID=3154871 RepID=UPI00342FFA91
MTAAQRQTEAWGTVKSWLASQGIPFEELNIPAARLGDGMVCHVQPSNDEGAAICLFATVGQVDNVGANTLAMRFLMKKSQEYIYGGLGMSTDGSVSYSYSLFSDTASRNNFINALICMRQAVRELREELPGYCMPGSFTPTTDALQGSDSQRYAATEDDIRKWLTEISEHQFSSRFTSALLDKLPSHDPQLLTLAADYAEGRLARTWNVGEADKPSYWEFWESVRDSLVGLGASPPEKRAHSYWDGQ